MNIVLWLALGLVGGVLGVLAAYRTFPSGATQWVGALLVGLVGGALGGWLLGIAGLETAGWVGSVVVAFLGSWGLLEVLKRTGTAMAGQRQTEDSRA